MGLMGLLEGSAIHVRMLVRLLHVALKFLP